MQVMVSVEVSKEGVGRMDDACRDVERKAVITVGKLPENDIVIEHPSSSR